MSTGYHLKRNQCAAAGRTQTRSRKDPLIPHPMEQTPKYTHKIPDTNIYKRFHTQTPGNPPRRWWRRGTWRLGRCQRPNGCAPRAQLPAEELLPPLQGSTHETPSRSDGARPSSSSTGAGSCVHDERVWTGVGCERTAARAQAFFLEEDHAARRWLTTIAGQQGSSTAAGAAQQRLRARGDDAAEAQRQRGPGASHSQQQHHQQRRQQQSSGACGAVAREWNQRAVRARVA